MSYRSSLESILSMHLRCQSCTNVGTPTTTNAVPFSPHLLVKFTQNYLLPTLRRYYALSGQGDDISDEARCRPDGYRTLNRTTAELYCRQLMDTVLWWVLTTQYNGVTKRDCIPDWVISTLAKIVDVVGRTLSEIYVSVFSTAVNQLLGKCWVRAGAEEETDRVEIWQILKRPAPFNHDPSILRSFSVVWSCMCWSFLCHQ